MSDKEKDHVAGLAIQIPEAMITAAIMTELARSMPDRDRMIEAVIRQALTEKDSSYDRETKFEKTVKKMIHEVAAEVMKAWIDTNKEAIRKAFLAALDGNRKKNLIVLADKMVDGLTKIHIRSIDLDLTEE